LRFASLGSGSSGNGLMVESGATRVLLDCGFSLREVQLRLARLGIEAASLSAILITHEHEDHASGVFGLARRHSIPVLASHGTLAVLREGDLGADAGVQVRLVCGGEWAEVGDLAILPYTVPHDAREPVQYMFSDGARRLGVLTDAGYSTAHMHAVLTGCDALVLETNHDRALLMSGDYPRSLKARISGRLGHMDNATAAALLSAIDCSRLKHVVAAHLSERNNTPELARAALAGALGCETEWVEVATQAAGFAWRSLV
jgi:phosphoribosyl 1,2-cyclic phosphodiesterase